MVQKPTPVYSGKTRRVVGGDLLCWPALAGQGVAKAPSAMLEPQCSRLRLQQRTWPQRRCHQAKCCSLSSAIRHHFPARGAAWGGYGCFYSYSYLRHQRLRKGWECTHQLFPGLSTMQIRKK